MNRGEAVIYLELTDIQWFVSIHGIVITANIRARVYFSFNYIFETAVLAPDFDPEDLRYPLGEYHPDGDFPAEPEYHP